MRDTRYEIRNTKYMLAALKLARRGIGAVEPNPAVGAVLVESDRIIGRGWHRRFGGPHAEINALDDCKEQGASPRGATMYVTLEPCCHYAKTAPCTDAIIAAGLAKVVVATIDTSEYANGKGIEQLRKAGIEVETDVCETEAKLLNAPFIKFASTGRSWVILKWAQSIDGKMAWADKAGPPQRLPSQDGAGGGHRWISNELSRKDAHKIRQRVQGILVGIGTVLADDPLLTVRPDKAKQPTRIVLDGNLKVPLDCKLLATAKETAVLIVTSRKAIEAKPKKAEKISKKGAEVLALPIANRRRQVDIDALLDELSRRGIAQLLVEGGPRVIASFLKEQLADEFIVYIAPKILGREGSSETLAPMAELAQAVDLNCVEIKRFGDDVRLSGFSKRALEEISVAKGQI